VALLRVIRPGLLTTVQDLGRWGYQAEGVPVGGPMDAYSHRLANRLASNHDDAAALEITLVGPELEAVGDVLCAMAGAEFEVIAGGQAVPGGRPFRLSSGTRLLFGRRMAGARATLAVRGGIDVPAVLGSRATSLPSRMGPFGGRSLEAGDILPIGASIEDDHGEARSAGDVSPLPLPQGGVRLRAMAGPDAALFPPGAIDDFFAARFMVSVASNRMGYRLDGPPIPSVSEEVLSEPTPFGSVQVPRGGQPILLMADRQTTGGYPRIATVISADVPLAGQLAPGDWIRFAPCSRGDAVDALRRQARRLAGHPEPSRGSRRSTDGA
jgi:antagonist of KipI